MIDAFLFVYIHIFVRFVAEDSVEELETCLTLDAIYGIKV